MTLEGGSEQKRHAIRQFKRDADTRVFLLHANSQASGLTLVAAQHVFLVEPMTHLAREEQAIHRVHRIGQKHVTWVHRFIVEDSVETKLYETLQLQRQQRASNRTNTNTSRDEVPVPNLDLMALLA